MKKEMKNIEEEVKKTMASLDAIEKASPKPFLFTRLTARMEESPLESQRQFDLKPVFVRLAMACLVVLLVFNFVTATLFIGTDSVSSQEYDTETLFIDQYYPTMTTIENIEQNLKE